MKIKWNYIKNSEWHCIQLELNQNLIFMNWIEIYWMEFKFYWIEFKFNRIEMRCKLVNRVLKICLAVLLFVHLVLKNNSFKNTLFHPIEVNSKSRFIFGITRQLVDLTFFYPILALMPPSSQEIFTSKS